MSYDRLAWNDFKAREEERYQRCLAAFEELRREFPQILAVDDFLAFRFGWNAAQPLTKTADSAAHRGKE